MGRAGAALIASYVLQGGHKEFEVEQALRAIKGHFPASGIFDHPSWRTKDQTEGSLGSSKALMFSIHAPQCSHNFITMVSLVLGEPGSRTGLGMT